MTEYPLVRIGPKPRWASLSLVDVWEYPHLLLRFGLRDVKLRYRQTYLGVAWVVLQLLLSAGIASMRCRLRES